MTGSGALYLYGVSPAPANALAPALAGLKGATEAPPEALDCGDARMIVASHDGSELLQTRRRMLAHARVLEAAMGVATVLPMRFGVVADDAAQVRALVARHGDRIAAQIERLAGQVEIGLRVRVAQDAALAALLADRPDLAAARDRLSGRGAEAHFERIELGRHVAEALERRRTEAQHVLAGLIGGACRAHLLRAPEADTELLRAECLVEAGGEADLARRVEEAAARLPFAGRAEPVVHVVGPAPAFHFVDLALDPGPPDRAGEAA